MIRCIKLIFLGIRSPRISTGAPTKSSRQKRNVSAPERLLTIESWRARALALFPVSTGLKDPFDLPQYVEDNYPFHLRQLDQFAVHFQSYLLVQIFAGFASDHLA